MSSRTIAACAALACALGLPAPGGVLAAEPERGRLVVYLERLPSDARRLSFELAGVEAVREDGSSVPLTLDLPRPGSEPGGPQRRLLASGSLPDGRYLGLAVRAASARLQTEEGEAELRVPEGPERVSAPFTVAPRRGEVLELRLDTAAALGEGFLFHPAFLGQVPARPAFGLVAAATLRDAGSLVVFDKHNGQVTGMTPVGRAPAGLAIDPLRRRAYVALRGEDALVAVDLEQNAILDRRSVRVGDEPVDLALTPDGSLLLVANERSSTVSLVEPEGLVEVGRIPVGEGPRAITLDRLGRRAWVTCVRSRRIDVIDLRSRSLAGQVSTDPGPLRAQLSRSGDRLYIPHSATPQLLVVDTATLAVIQRPFVGAGQLALAVDPKDDRLYLARRGTGVVEILAPSSFLAVDRLPLKGTVEYLAVDGTENALLLTLPAEREVRAIGTISRAATVEVDLGGEPAFVAVAPRR